MEKTLDLKKIVLGALLFLVALTPIFNFSELMAFFTKGGGTGITFSHSNVYTSVYIKAIKDLILIFVLGLLFLMALKTKKWSFYWVGVLIFLVFCFLGFWLMFIKIPLFALAGIRWILPFILIFLLIPYISKSFLKPLATVFFVLFLFHLALQFFQLFFFPRYFGVNFLGLNARNSGLFVIPGSGSIFSCQVLFLYHFYGPSQLIKKILHVLTFVSLLLAGSMGGLLGYFILLTIVLFKKKYLKLIPVIASLLGVTLAGAIFLFQEYGGRHGFLKASAGGRFDIIQFVIDNIHFLPSTFGIATNSSVALSKTYDVGVKGFIADTTYAEILGNFGWIGAAVFLVLSLLFIWAILFFQRKDITCFVAAFYIFSFGTTVPELFPTNIFFAIYFAYVLSLFRVRRVVRA